MKLVTFERNGERGYGISRGARVVLPDADFSRAYPNLRTVLADPRGLERLRRAGADSARGYPLAELTLLPPILDPHKILCVGINYETHRSETGRAASAYPAIFVRFADTQIGDGAAIVRPTVSTCLDFEGELAVVIGRGGRAIPFERALDHVAGYACYNDATLRDWQRHTHQFTPGKNFPHTGAFGPCLVTADDIVDPSALQLVTRLNGVTMQRASTADMIFSVGRIIEYISRFTPLSPGDVIATGTPGGVGFKRTPPIYVQPGDIVEVEISGIGTLRNPIVDECAGPAANVTAGSVTATHA